MNIPSREIVTKLPPLTEPLKDLPEAIYATAKSEQNGTQVTTLSNGLRVASENRFGQFCTIGVVIDSGPRYEVAYPSGVSHFLEKLAFHVIVPHANLIKIYIFTINLLLFISVNARIPRQG